MRKEGFQVEGRPPLGVFGFGETFWNVWMDLRFLRPGLQSGGDVEACGSIRGWWCGAVQHPSWTRQGDDVEVAKKRVGCFKHWSVRYSMLPNFDIVCPSQIAHLQGEANGGA